jgi:hypothetical protein
LVRSAWRDRQSSRRICSNRATRITRRDVRILATATVPLLCRSAVHVRTQTARVTLAERLRRCAVCPLIAQPSSSGHDVRASHVRQAVTPAFKRALLTDMSDSPFQEKPNGWRRRVAAVHRLARRSHGVTHLIAAEQGCFTWIEESLAKSRPPSRHDRRKETANHDFKDCSKYGLSDLSCRPAQHGGATRIQAASSRGVLAVEKSSASRWTKCWSPFPSPVMVPKHHYRLASDGA